MLVRTPDDARLAELQAAGATEVVPETFEASLMLVSQVLLLLRVPLTRVVRAVGEIRNSRYALLRSVVSRDGEHPIDDTNEHEEEVKSVVLPPQAWAIGRTIAEARARGAQVAFTATRRLEARRRRSLAVFVCPQALLHVRCAASQQALEPRL